ncbi:uncharacterized protein LOC143294299 isoform X1 [Babylonia areolata]|uniref:uncharacterized protein LOC143294299 isoform X1 n=1 Tax=Babylonia areolata TaxID=304850 RepID=UPI003FD55A31
MKSVTVVRLFVVVLAVFRTSVCGVFVSPGGLNGGQRGGTGAYITTVISFSVYGQCATHPLLLGNFYLVILFVMMKRMKEKLSPCPGSLAFSPGDPDLRPAQPLSCVLGARLSIGVLGLRPLLSRDWCPGSSPPPVP